MDREAEMRELAVRAWTAAESIDAIRGGRGAWDWTWGQVVRLYREGRQNDPDAVRPVVEALEDRLEMEREPAPREVR